MCINHNEVTDMRFFHFKAQELPIEARIFAVTRKRAAELFFLYGVIKGHRVEDFIWRELTPENLDEPEQSRLREALLLKLDGIATLDAAKGWVPIPTIMPDFHELDHLED
jgi:hypothetical protein